MTVYMYNTQKIGLATFGGVANLGGTLLSEFIGKPQTSNVTVMSVLQTVPRCERITLQKKQSCHFIDYPQYTKGTGYTGNPQNNHYISPQFETGAMSIIKSSSDESLLKGVTNNPMIKVNKALFVECEQISLSNKYLPLKIMAKIQDLINIKII